MKHKKMGVNYGMKKKYFYFVLLGIMLLVIAACVPNTPPSTPANPDPKDGAPGVSLKPTLKWSASVDAEGDVIKYDLYFSKNPNSLSKIASDLQESSYDFTQALECETMYFWKVVAKDGRGGQTPGPIWSFTTKDNDPPTQPMNPTPLYNTENVPVKPTLSWQASTDPDGDDVAYDLYLGTDEEDLSVKASDLETNSYTFTQPLNYETTYYWQVVAKDGQGGETPGDVWKFTTKANESPTAPTIPDPANGETGVSVKPTLSWQASTDPDETTITYDLYFGEAQDSLSVKASDLDTNSYEFEEPLNYETTYYWKVVAKDGQGGETPGDVWSFTTKANEAPSAPSNPNPGDETIGVPVTPTLSWDESTDPDETTITYDLYLGTDEEKLEEDPVVKASNLTTNSYTFTESLVNGITYYWKVVAKDGQGGETSSEVWSFRINCLPTAPSNPDPENGATDVKVRLTLSWQASDEDDDALTYDLYLGTTPQELSLKESNLTTNSYTFTESLEYEKTYYWLVIAKDGRSGQTLGPVWSFTTKANEPPTAPANPNPENGETGVSVIPILRWQESTDPDETTITYDLYFGEDQDSLSVKASNLETNSYTFAESLVNGTTYYWKVVAKDGQGGETSSEIWSFTTNYPPTAPSNPEPASGATGVSVTPTLRWDESTDPDETTITYDLYLGKTQSNLSLKASNLDTASYDLTESLDEGTRYYWKVVAKDGKGGQTPGPVWNFKTNYPPSEPSNPSPENGATGVSVKPTLSWQASTDDDEDTVKYDLYLGTDEKNLEENPLVKVSDLDTNSYEFTQPLNYGTTYYWKVVAKDGKGEASGPIWNFTTTTED